VVSLALVACGEPETATGACSITEDEPVLRILSVVDSATGTPLPQVRLSDISENGRSFADQIYFLVNGPVEGITRADPDLLCTPSCAFGFDEGLWRLTVSRDGYLPVTLELELHYRRRTVDERCLIHLSGATEVHLSLQRE
jgi:hypothetical protein